MRLSVLLLGPLRSELTFDLNPGLLGRGGKEGDLWFHTAVCEGGEGRGRNGESESVAGEEGMERVRVERRKEGMESEGGEERGRDGEGEGGEEIGRDGESEGGGRDGESESGMRWRGVRMEEESLLCIGNSDNKQL